MTAKYELTDEHRAEFPRIRDWWIANAFSTADQTDEDRSEVTAALYKMYELAKLDAPKAIVFVQSPFTAAISAGIAAGWWHARDQGGYKEPALRAAAAVAAERAVAVGKAVLWTGDKTGTAPADPAAVAAVNNAVLAAVLDTAPARTTKPAKGTKTTKVDNKLVDFYLQCVARANRMYASGNMWSGYSAYLAFFEDVAKLPIDWSVGRPFRTCAERSGFRYMHGKFTIVSNRPSALHHDGPMPHHPTEASHQWRDGWSMWFWRGLRVPGQWYTPGFLTADKALTQTNIELRRAACEIVGWTNILRDLPSRVLDENPDAQVGTLYEVDLPDSPNERFLRVLCGTGRTFFIPVPREYRTAEEANAATQGITVEEFRSLQLRT